MIIKKRRIRTFGLFAPRHWVGLDPHRSNHAWLYWKLRGLGFQETIWQYIYEGQLGGIVLPLNGGKREIHVRFYADGVEAELEIGRWYLSHFWTPRSDAVDQVMKLLSPHLTAEELRYLRRTLKTNGGRFQVPLSAAAGITFGEIGVVALSAVLAATILGIISIGTIFVTAAVVFAFSYSFPTGNPSVDRMPRADAI